ncbi:hypothetical protein J7K06_02810 [Candidatus Bathyarchaeota archaeon]|nr:hypothetical protein [Candidatus Bathyarchaeota archaeon]
MSLRDYLHEKAEESRHNETIGYLIAIMGSIFMIGGILETLIAVEKPHSWFLFFPYNSEKFMGDPYSLLGLSLDLVGLVLLALGIILCVHYALERAWYMNELRKTQSAEEEKMFKRKRKKLKIK